MGVKWVRFSLRKSGHRSHATRLLLSCLKRYVYVVLISLGTKDIVSGLAQLHTRQSRVCPTRKFASSVVGNQTLFRSTFGFKQCLRSCYSFYFSLYEHGKALAGSALALFRLRYFVRNVCTGGISTEYLLCFFLIHEHKVERSQEVSTGNFLRLLIP